MNLTDVDDRTIAAAGEKGVPLRAHVDPFAWAFEEDRDWLRIRPPHEQPLEYPAGDGHAQMLGDGRQPAVWPHRVAFAPHL